MKKPPRARQTLRGQDRQPKEEATMKSRSTCHGRAPIDIAGQRFGSWTAISHADGKLWKVRCDCGFVAQRESGKLRGGHTTSCPKCAIPRMAATKQIYGDPAASFPEYSVWRGIITRCFNKRDKAYPRYGGRGITMAPEWRHSFEKFRADVGLRPSPEHSLDRFPDNNGNYEPGNVRWATRKEQQNNRRNNVMITRNGRTMTRTQWAEELGTPIARVEKRVSKFGWSEEEALTRPLAKRAALSDAERAELIRRFDAGEKRSDIAKYFGLASGDCVRQIARSIKRARDDVR